MIEIVARQIKDQTIGISIYTPFSFILFYEV
jgi:hypothetical protein